MCRGLYRVAPALRNHCGGTIKHTTTLPFHEHRVHTDEEQTKRKPAQSRGVASEDSPGHRRSWLLAARQVVLPDSVVAKMPSMSGRACPNTLPTSRHHHRHRRNPCVPRDVPTIPPRTAPARATRATTPSAQGPRPQHCRPRLGPTMPSPGRPQDRRTESWLETAREREIANEISNE